MGSAVSGLSIEQIASIGNDIVFECIGTFGAVDDYNHEQVQQIAQKYIQVSEREREKNFLLKYTYFILRYLGIARSRSNDCIVTAFGIIRIKFHSHWFYTQ